MKPSNVKSGMVVTYNELKSLVVAPFLNYVLIEQNGKQIKIHYSQIKEHEPEQIDRLNKELPVAINNGKSIRSINHPGYTIIDDK